LWVFLEFMKDTNVIFGADTVDNFTGLSQEEAASRLIAYGPNALPVPKHRFLKLIIRQLRGIINIILIVAAAVTFSLNEIIDGFFILFYVILGTAMNVYQEYRSNQAAEKLKQLLHPTSTLIRDNRETEIHIEEIVPGDILKLVSGDIVPADAKVLKVSNLMVDESSFTGESVAIYKTEAQGNVSVIMKENQLLQGSLIVTGYVYAEVIATGIHTQLALISKESSEVDSESELVNDFDRISKTILKITLVTLIFIIAANVLIEGTSTDFVRLLIFGIALAVSVIPEALPLVLTFSLSHGAIEFSKHGVIVKRLSAVHDLGSVNLLCTDKTGTITENHLTFVDSIQAEKSIYHPLILARLASTDLHKRIPQPFDRASDEALTKTQVAEIAAYELIEEEVFDPILRRNGVTVKHSDGQILHIFRGSPEFFTQSNLIIADQYKPWLEAQENMGHRILGVSYDTSEGMRFGGFVAFEDKLKPTTTDALNAAKHLNVKITIITGDAHLVTLAVAQKSGLIHHSEEIIDATEFLALPHEEQNRLAGTIRAFTRANPQQKLALINLLKQQFSVGYLGDGINDAAALKAAHVSLVVEGAADVARETADIILLKKNLKVIIDGIRLGRETHVNTMKYVRGTLISNFGNFYSVAIASLFISFLPMLPKQLLLLNLLSDFPMMAIAFDRVSKKEIAYPQKIEMHTLFMIILILAVVSTMFDFVFFALFFRISPEVLQTNWFIGSVLTELFFIFSLRSFLPINKAGLPAPIILWLMLGSIIVTIALPLIPLTAGFFGFIQPQPLHLFLIISLSVFYLIISELVKQPISKYILKK